ncbi:MAG: IS3 family transposase [Turicibacter sp.]|nr:IS3 family transposase [Turicibacter sp.]
MEPKNQIETKVIQELTDEFKLADILKVTKFPKSTYYYWIKKMKQDNPHQELEDLILTIFKENDENYGYRRVTIELHNKGIKINHKKVYRLMKKLGLTCVKYSHKTCKYRSYKGTIGTVAKNLINRRFKTPYPYQKLTTDVTEFKTQEGKKLYLSPIMDLGTGEILSFSMSHKPDLNFVMESLHQALPILRDAKYRTTIHSDQGWQYQHQKWVKTLKKHHIFQSMSRKGNCLDNSPMENFFGILKQEMYYGKVYQTYRDLKDAIQKYIYYYNHKRIKRKLAGMSPVQYRIHTSQLAA